MIRSPREGAIVAMTVAVGLLVGGELAIKSRGPVQHRHRPLVAAARVTPVPATPQPARWAQPAARAVAVAVPATPVATPAPPIKTMAPATPAPDTAAATVPIARASSWEVDESGTSVGTIVWTGSASAAGGGAIALDLHKVRVAGHGVGPCERATHLRATLTGAQAQTVPYQETNCAGATASGEMRIAAGDGRHLTGSFWSNGAKLGDFTATAL